MRLLVTGGAGYIGSVVVRHLLQAEHQVVVLDNLSTGCAENLPTGARLEAGDLDDRELLDKLLPDVDGVLHFGAAIEVAESMAHPLAYFQRNVATTITLLEAMQQHGVERFLFSSTAAVYGTPVSCPVTEEHPLQPTNPYGESKLAVEKVLQWQHQCGKLRYASLRYFNAAGGRIGRRAVNLIPIVLEVARGERPCLEIFGDDYPTNDGTAVRDYIHVDDLASAHLLALDALEHSSQLIYNIGNGVGFSVREVVEAARKVTGHEIPVVISPRRSGDPAAVVACSEKIRKELGWQASYDSLESIVQNSYESSSPLQQPRRR